MQEYIVYLIRHAKSEANITHVYGTDAPLSAEGIKQAEESIKQAAEGIKQAENASIDIDPDVVISGQKKRQMQTAKILFPDKYREETTPVFNEIYFGDLENTVIGNKAESDLVKDVSLNHIKHGGDDVWARAEQAIKFIENIQTKYPDKTVAIVTSDTLTQAIITRLVYGKVNGVIWSGQYYVPNCTCVAFKCAKGHIKEIEMPDHTVLSVKHGFNHAKLHRNGYER